ncbi:MAG: hypothetical protein M3R24_05410 [Chloroflexota bacterium]|nr:hypothetical protein [Chloroflexota bacterium]
MARAPFQVLVFPYHQRSDGIYVFAVFRRADDPYWQGIAGGGEGDETPRQARNARRLRKRVFHWTPLFWH